MITRQPINIRLLFLFTFPPEGHSSCAYRPIHTFTMTVRSCQEITIQASISKYGQYKIDKTGSSITGTILNGDVRDHLYNWEGIEPYDRYDPWNNGESIFLFIHQDADELCNTELPKEMRLLASRRCCDTSPRDGICLVRFPTAHEANR